jgi:glycosyltransferase involved in cell wall biosynthesis
MTMMDKVLLSVCFITYNHKDYIKQSLDSVLMQNTNFDYEIVIGEDCSTDGTRKIVFECVKNIPKKLK